MGGELAPADDEPLLERPVLIVRRARRYGRPYRHRQDRRWRVATQSIASTPPPAHVVDLQLIKVACRKHAY